jgi:protein SCO1/2
MPRLKIALILTLAFMLQACSKPPEWHGSDVSGMLPDLAFDLIGPEGDPLSASSLRGKPVLVFFGFTNCPDVCPTTLTQLSMAVKKLGPQSNDVQILLVSVDPERDTPEVMKNYTAAFGPWLLGLTGEEGVLEALRKSYGVYAAMESSDSKGTYNVMHSTAVFAFDSEGHVRLLISDVNNVDAVASDLRQLIDL